MPPAPLLTFNNGVQIPQVGFGVFLIPFEETQAAVATALQCGYRHIDTAKIYENESAVGKAIAESGLERSEIFVTTKCWNPDQGFDSALRAFDGSMERLGLDYLDLYLIHWPVPLVHPRYWRQLEALQERGLAKEIGVSNYSRDQLEALRQAGLKTPAVNQVHFSPFHHSHELLEYCDQHGIVLVAYSPLERGRGLNDSTIVSIAEVHGRTPAQVMLRWAIQHQTVVIPKSSREDRIRSNAELFDFELSEADMQLLDALS